MIPIEEWDDIESAEEAGFVPDDELNPNYFEQEMEAREHQLKRDISYVIIREWIGQQSSDRGLRKSYGLWILIILSIETLAFTTAFVLASIGIIKIENATLPYWLGALIIEVIGIVSIIARGRIT